MLYLKFYMGVGGSKMSGEKIAREKCGSGKNVTGKKLFWKIAHGKNATEKNFSGKKCPGKMGIQKIAGKKEKEPGPYFSYFIWIVSSTTKFKQKTDKKNKTQCELVKIKTHA